MEISEVKFCTNQGAGIITAGTVGYYLIQGLKLSQLAIDPVEFVNLRSFVLRRKSHEDAEGDAQLEVLKKKTA